MKRNKKVVHTFYHGNDSVWISEWPGQLDIEALQAKAAEIREMGYGDADIVTDTTGRLIRLK